MAIQVELVAERVEPLVAELVPAQLVDSAPRRALRPLRWFLRGLGALVSAADWLFGLAVTILGLATLAAIPIVQLLSLGYLLEAGGRIARTGRFRDGFIGIRQASRLGGVILGVWVVSWPVWLVASYWRSARLIEPGGATAQLWALGFVVALALTLLHIVSALLRGGRLRHFAWPLFNPLRAWRRFRAGGVYAAARDRVYDFVVSMRLPYYFWLGLRGFVGGLAWLALPVTLLALSRQAPAGLLVAVPLLAVVLLYLPLLQVHFAREQRFRAMFDLRAVQRIFARAPMIYWLAVTATLLLALPLYLLKIEMIPREAAWLPGLFFVTFNLPARWLAGWAYARGQRREKPRFWAWRWFWRIGLLPPVALYILVLFFTQYAAWYGVWSLYEQHAFLVPAPFFSSSQ